MNILFVCTGNTCRSPMAEYIFRRILKDKNLDENVSVSSGGIAAFSGDAMAYSAQEVLHDLWHIDGSMHRSQGLDRELLMKQDLIVTMTASHAEYIKKQLPEAAEKIKTLTEAVTDSAQFLDRQNAEKGERSEIVYTALSSGDIIDPYGQSYDVYESTARLLHEYLTILADYIETKSRS